MGAPHSDSQPHRRPHGERRSHGSRLQRRAAPLLLLLVVFLLLLLLLLLLGDPRRRSGASISWATAEERPTPHSIPETEAAADAVLPAHLAEELRVLMALSAATSVTGVVGAADDARWRQRAAAVREQRGVQLQREEATVRDANRRGLGVGRRNAAYDCGCLSVASGGGAEGEVGYEGDGGGGGVPTPLLRAVPWCPGASAARGAACALRGLCIMKGGHLAIASTAMHPAESSGTSSPPLFHPDAPPNEELHGIDVCGATHSAAVIFRPNATRVAEWQVQEQREMAAEAARQAAAAATAQSGVRDGRWDAAHRRPPLAAGGGGIPPAYFARGSRAAASARRSVRAGGGGGQRQRPRFTHRDVAAATWLNGTTVLIDHDAREDFPRVLGALGLLHAARTTGADPECGGEGRTTTAVCGTVTRVVSLGSALDAGGGEGWLPQVARALLCDIAGSVDFSTAASFAAATGSVCFETAVLPTAGHASLVPPAAAAAAAARDDLWQHLRRAQRNRVRTLLARHLAAEQTTSKNAALLAKDAALLADADAAARRRVRFAPQWAHPRGRLVLLLRHSRPVRRVVDWGVLQAIVRTLAASAGAALEVVDPHGLSFLHRASLASRATLLVGVHGPELLDALFQLPAGSGGSGSGSAVVELNPLFFFGNEVAALADAVGVHYAAWTCTARTCAFGGPGAAAGGWARFIERSSAIRFDEASRRFVREPLRRGGLINASVEPRDGGAGGFAWPWDRAARDACPECVELARSGGLKPIFGSVLRNSDIKVAGHVAEIVQVVRGAMRVVGWLASEDGGGPVDATDEISRRPPERYQPFDDDELRELKIRQRLGITFP